MRDYLFRGKDIKTKEWVYGNFVKVQNEETAITDSQDVIHKVSPETIGQYSGVSDGNGVKVFEGDRVTGEAKNIYETLIEGVLIVVFEDGAFWVTGKTKYDRIGYCLLWDVCYLKVIGNIHDEEGSDEA